MSQPLTVVLGTYLAELAEVDAVRAEHLAWIDKHVAAGRVLIAGRRTPPDGSVIIMRGLDAEAAHALLEDDPYAINGLVRYDVAGIFTPGKRATGLDELLA